MWFLLTMYVVNRMYFHFCAMHGANSMSTFGKPNSHWASGIARVLVSARTLFKSVERNFVKRIGVAMRENWSVLLGAVHIKIHT